MGIEETVFDGNDRDKLLSLKNGKVLSVVDDFVSLCRPSKVRVITDSEEDAEYVRQLAVANREEARLATEGHTIHFDSYHDQGRDKANTKILLPKGTSISKSLNAGDREECLEEILYLMDSIMLGKEMLVGFFCLGPLNSDFSISALQLTDSAYVMHSEQILYRPGYEQFKRLKDPDGFFHFVHSAGQLDYGLGRKVSGRVKDRRIYIDLQENRVLTINNQYAGNSVGLKKLALRLAINKADKEGWLTEHMFVMGARPEGKDRATYFSGAFPSACGKTSTAMIPGQSIIGDDIAYIKKRKDGKAYAVNIEKGIFGIIENVNPVDDPLIYEVLATPRELIFSNVLTKDDVPYWLGMGKELPKDGVNHYGEWQEGKKDEEGNAIAAAHKNARYTIRIDELANADPMAEHPEGVPVQGFIYGGRDSDTSPPVVQSLSWAHGVFMGASLESETTAATLGKAGVRKHNAMANMDFLTIPLGKYLENHLRFGKSLKKAPLVFNTNYFLKENDKFTNEKVDKKVWLMWMEGRVHDEFDAVETPVGFIPKYDDLKGLFRQIFGKDYSEEEYVQQFSIKTDSFLEKLDRIEAIFKDEENMPKAFGKHLKKQRKRLKKAKKKHGSIASPLEFK